MPLTAKLCAAEAVPEVVFIPSSPPVRLNVCARVTEPADIKPKTTNSQGHPRQRRHAVASMKEERGKGELGIRVA